MWCQDGIDIWEKRESMQDGYADRNQRADAFCNGAEDTSAYEYRKAEDTSRRNGNQFGAASYD